MAVLLTICVFNLSSDLFHEDHAPDPYPHALGILHALKARGIDMAIASRSRTPEIARLFLEKLGVRSMFVAEVRQEMHFCCLFFLSWFVIELNPFYSVPYVFTT